MKITDFNVLITKKQKGRVKVDIAQTAEHVRIIRQILKEKAGFDIYKLIRRGCGEG